MKVILQDKNKYILKAGVGAVCEIAFEKLEGKIEKATMKKPA